ncbi:MAG: hypothetical protein HZB92_04295 [Euryarchaeota archaeon]|nr:hypothetical protein [Euryarchaeota archaeon]
MDYGEAVRYLYDLQYLGVKFGLENTAELLFRLGGPHTRYKTVHVAGTNGKGSVCALVSSVLTAAGYRTGLYTSPHLIDFTERVKVDGKAAAREDIARLTAEIIPHLEAMRKSPEERLCTFFEATTALAFKHFENEGVDVAVMETGMGGRLDSTNVIVPEASVITRLGMDHMKYLGGTLAKIAREKAGIIKPGVPVVSAAQEGDALHVIRQTAAERGSKLRVEGIDFHCSRKSFGIGGQRLSYRGSRGRPFDVDISLLGKFQVENAGLALCAIEVLRERGFGIPDGAIRKGMKGARWPARLQVVRKNPLVVVDGMHNPNAAQAVADSWGEVFGKRKVRLVLGIMADKDYPRTASTVSSKASMTIATAPAFQRALPADRLARDIGAAEYYDIPADAIVSAIRGAGDSSAVLIAGSLYLAGEALMFLGDAPPDSVDVFERLQKEYSIGAFPGHDVGGNEAVEPGGREPFHVLISTILSHRTRDENTHRASSALLARYGTPESLAKAPVAEVERLVRPSGFYRMKARYVKAAAKAVVDDFGGNVPRDIGSLMAIPAVGRKTANCVLVYGFGIPAIPVDVHVHRVSNRLGLVKTKTPDDTETILATVVPKSLWIDINRLLVRHGQEVCQPRRPRCPKCVLRGVCMLWRRESLPVSQKKKGKGGR